MISRTSFTTICPRFCALASRPACFHCAPIERPVSPGIALHFKAAIDFACLALKGNPRREEEARRLCP
jgi:hypothetical protein